MTFKQLLEKVRIELAMFIAQDRVPENFLKELTFDQWLKIFLRHSSDSSLKQTALHKLIELAETFDERLKACCQAPSGSELERVALDKISKTEATFDQWLEVYMQTPSGSNLKRVALDKLR